MSLTSLPPLALYVHIPWCVRKCPYCDFNSHAIRQPLPEAGYVRALLADLEQELPLVWGRRIASIFIGGGTPSLLSPAAIDQVLSGVRARIACAPAAEITLEANPGTVDTGRFAGFRSAGVNRLSIGVQSFQPRLLARLGRIHGRDEAIAAFTGARAAGFDNINLDLMFGLPGQSAAEGVADIETALGLAPEHISYYQLTLEPNTWFYRYPPRLPADVLVADMQRRCQERLVQQGYEQYEVSAYARGGRRCLHNLNYWRFGDYLGIGAGAHGKISLPDRIIRRWKLKHPAAYMEGVQGGTHLGGESALSPPDLALEFMMNALRLAAGFPTELLAQRTGLSIAAVQRGLRQGAERGLIDWDASRIRPTAKGLRYLDDLLLLFVPDAERGDGEWRRPTEGQEALAARQDRGF